MPKLVLTATPGSSRELCVLAGCHELVLLAGELGEALDDDGPCRHVDPERQGLGREHDLDQTLLEQFLDGFLEGRDHPRVMGGNPVRKARDPLVIAEDVELLFGELGGADVGVLGDPLALIGRR